MQAPPVRHPARGVAQVSALVVVAGLSLFTFGLIYQWASPGSRKGWGDSGRELQAQTAVYSLLLRPELVSELGLSASQVSNLREELFWSGVVPMGMIGIRPVQKGDFPAVAGTFLDNLPAERAGIRAGDVIAAVDGSSVEGLPLDAVVRKIRGEPGTRVDITYFRGGNRWQGETTVELTRAAIRVRPYTPVWVRAQYLRARVAETLSDEQYLRWQQYLRGTGY